MNNFCSNFGEKIKEGADVCLSCGRLLSNISNNDIKSSNNVKTGNGIASMVLGMFGVFITIACIGILSDMIDYSESFYMLLGPVVFSLIVSVTAICLAISERSSNKNGFNTAGFWLSLSAITVTTIIILVLIFIVPFI